ncbi:hypothetical protein HAX54_048936, partial [Datura stramonium]|nr:hypothetical protein [Datura stramonium]
IQRIWLLLFSGRDAARNNGRAAERKGEEGNGEVTGEVRRAVGVRTRECCFAGVFVVFAGGYGERVRGWGESGVIREKMREWEYGVATGKGGAGEAAVAVRCWGEGENEKCV